MERLSALANVYYAGNYMRLSKDDDVSGDSVSIQNQRLVLKKYCEENNFIVASEYVDDGYSGTNFNRPAFMRMLKDIEQGRINCVIVKDLSRFGRNYLEVGQYLENYFPARNVRFIAINDNVDTNKGDSDLVPFMNIFNEFHAKQTSKKLRQVHENASQAGECHYVYPPMGYLKDPANKKKLIVDRDSAWIVQKIFELAEAGNGAYTIQKWLYENKVITPGYREYVNWGGRAKVYRDAPESRRYEWGLANIKNMLKNPLYLGHMVRYKNRSISFKNKKRTKFDPSQWVVVKNTHEPLISQETFDNVQSLIASRRRSTSSGEVQLFAHIARCSQCGNALRFGTNRQRPGFEYQYLYCASKDEKPVDSCTTHYIRYDTLQEIVLSKIQELYASVNIDRKHVLNKLIQLEADKTKHNLQLEQEEYDNLQKRNAELEKLVPRLYEDWVSNKISEQLFSQMTSKFQNEQMEIATRLAELSKTLQANTDNQSNVEKWLAEIENLVNPTTLTRTMVFNLIEKIVVHEAIGPKGSRKKKPRVDIYWKFVGPIE